MVDLPDPDSPTSPSVLPASMSKLTPSTALTSPTVREIRKEHWVRSAHPVSERTGRLAGSGVPV